MSDVIPFSTDLGTLALFDPDELRHRVREPSGWWRRDWQEVNEGRIHQGAALGWLLGARGSIRSAEPEGEEELFGDEPPF